MGSGKWHERADEALDVRASILAVLGFVSAADLQVIIEDP